MKNSRKLERSGVKQREHQMPEPKMSMEESCEVCACGCILAKHYVSLIPGEPFCSACSKCSGFEGTGKTDTSQLRDVTATTNKKAAKTN